MRWRKRALVLVIALAALPLWVAAAGRSDPPHPAAAVRLLASYDPPPQRLIAYQWAVTQQGKPYCWGGIGPRCYDCSGLVMEAYLQAGIWLPRTAAAMQRDRQLYRIRRPLLGDVVLYGRPAYHAALYAGDGRIFDALNAETAVGWRPDWWPGVPQFYRVRGGSAP